MSHRFFISHSNSDKTIAELFSKALSRITLEQISPWFSSDSSGQSGLKPGDIWFNQILTRLKTSRAVIALLTPNSINRPWIYFESGIGQTLDDCEIIPVCIGLKRDSVLPPLGLYQCYQLNDYRSVVEFFSKLLALFDIKFDEEMARTIIEKMVADLSKCRFKIDKKEEEKSQSFAKVFEDFKNHIDMRFIEVLKKPTYSIKGNGLNLNIEELNTKAHSNESFVDYSLLFSVKFPDFSNDLYIDIRESDTFQSLTNTLYFMINDYVSAFTYLEEWIIVNKESNMHVVIREVANLIPAVLLFPPNSEWEIRKLDKSYSPEDSKIRM